MSNDSEITRVSKLEDTIRFIKDELNKLCKSNSEQGCGVCIHRPREFCRWGKILDEINKL